MTTKKPAATRRRKTAAPTFATTSVDNGDGTTTIHPVDPGDTPHIAAALLAAASTPGDVATVTTPHGWRVPTTVAKDAGMGR